MILQAACQPIEHDDDGHHTAGVGVDIGVQEKALGHEHGKKTEKPLQRPVPEPPSAQKQEEHSHDQTENKIHHAGRVKQNIRILDKAAHQPHGIALDHIGQNRLESIGKTIRRYAYGLFKAGGESAVLCDVLRDQIPVKLVRRVSEGLPEQERET